MIELNFTIEEWVLIHKALSHYEQGLMQTTHELIAEPHLEHIEEMKLKIMNELEKGKSVESKTKDQKK